MTEDSHENPFLAFLDPVTEEWRDGYVRLALDLRPALLNRSGVTHGGVIATLVDHAGAFAGLHCPTPGDRRSCVTLSLNVSYLAQTRSGRLVVTGEWQSGGRRIFFSNVTVHGGDGTLVATGSGVFRYRSGSETAQAAPAGDGTGI